MRELAGIIKVQNEAQGIMAHMNIDFSDSTSSESTDADANK